MSEKESTGGLPIGDSLLDAMQERKLARQERELARQRALELEARERAMASMEPDVADMTDIGPETAVEVSEQEPVAPALQIDVSEPLVSVNLDRMMGRLLLVMVILVVAVNIPFNRFGASLARVMPERAGIVIRDGLLLKGNDEKVYVLEDNKRRWITTLEAFEAYGYRWSQVQQVDDAFLQEFDEGFPIHVLFKCRTSPHIYAIEDSGKRWIKDIPTFEARGYVWEDVRFVSCSYLRNLPDSLPIPVDAGAPPQP